ncbi:hypothetical protein J6590_083479 [Homalodisca vitripennis]|nr:hypothetical protein J6590_083479 [Homalodisca vitripennis]
MIAVALAEYLKLRLENAESPATTSRPKRHNFTSRVVFSILSVSAMVPRGPIPALVCLCVFWSLSDGQEPPNFSLDRLTEFNLRQERPVKVGD